MQEKGRKSKTINNYLEVVGRVFKKAATAWFDESGKTWVSSVPYIEKMRLKDQRPPYPISSVEQTFLFAELESHLAEPALFAIHTGCREQEICQLKWEWEYRVPELDTSVFVLPASVTKNKEERVVPLNAVSRSIIESQRGKHPSRVFTHWSGNKKRGDKALVPLQKIYNSGWKSARERAADKYEEEMKDKAHWGFRNLRVHDLRHTFGRRLRAAGVSKETRSDLLGHKTGDITTHYSAAEIKELIEAVEKITSNNLQVCRYLVKDFGTSQSPKSTRQRDSRYCPDRPALITTPSRTLLQSCSCATPS
ncbi:MAG: site-specific integrase [gamma proteobacterium symbiont of Phacoides pectinatus]